MRRAVSAELEGVMDKVSLLRFIEVELSDIRRGARRPGWSPWALVAAFAAIVWTFIPMVANGISPAAVRAMLVALLALNLWRYLERLLAPASEPSQGGPVLLSNIELAGDRTQFLLAVIAAGYLLWLVPGVSHEVAIASVCGLVAWLILEVIVNAFGFLYSFWPVPVPSGAGGLHALRIIQLLVPVTLIVVAIFGYAASLGGIGVGNLQAGFLSAAGIAVLFQLAGEALEKPIVTELVRLRRAVYLDRLDLAEATRKARRLIDGLSLDDYVQEDAVHLMRALDELSQATTTFKPVVTQLADLANRLAQRELVHPNEWNGLMAEWDRKGEVADRVYRRVSGWRKRFTWRQAFALALARRFGLDYQPAAIIAEVEPELRQVLNEHGALLEEYQQMLARLSDALGRTAA